MGFGLSSSLGLGLRPRGLLGGIPPAVVLPPATFAMTQIPTANRVYQKSVDTGGTNGVGSGTLAPTVNVTVAGAIYARCRAVIGGAIVQASWLVTASAPVANGPLSITTVAARLGQFFLDLSSDGVAWTLGTTAVSMGDIEFIWGQSLACTLFVKATGQGTIASTGATIANTYCFATVVNSGAVDVAIAAWEMPSDAGRYSSSFVAEYGKLRSVARGNDIGLVGHVRGNTPVSEFTGTGTQAASIQAIAAAVGGYSRVIFFIGHSDSSQGNTGNYFRAGVCSVMNKLRAQSSRAFDTHGSTIPNVTLNAWGTVAQNNEIRRAGWEAALIDAPAWGGVGKYVQNYAITMHDGVHPAQAGAFQYAGLFNSAADQSGDAQSLGNSKLDLATVTPAYTINAGGQALSGGYGHMTTPNAGQLFATYVDALTKTFRFKTSAIPGGFQVMEGTGIWFSRMLDGSGNLRFYFNNVFVDVLGNWADGIEHFVSCVSTRTGTKVFIDNVERVSSATGLPANESGPFGVRDWGNGLGIYTFNGSIDDVAIWAGDRGGADPGALTGNEARLLQLWKLDGNGLSGRIDPASVVAAPMFTVQPITPTGTRLAGNTITSSYGTATGAAAYSGRWLLDGVPIGAVITSPSAVTILDATAYDGKSLSFASTATNSAGSAYAISGELASGAVPNTQFTTSFVAANGTAPTTNIGTNSVGAAAAMSVYAGGTNIDGTGANAAANQAAFTVQGNALSIPSPVGATDEHHGAKAVVNAGSVDQGIVITRGSVPYFPIVFGANPADGLNFHQLVPLTTGGNTFIWVLKYSAGVLTTIHNDRMGIVGDANVAGAKLKFEIIGGILRGYYDIAGTGTFTQMYYPSVFQGPPPGTGLAALAVSIPAGGTWMGVSQIWFSSAGLANDLVVYQAAVPLAVTSTSVSSVFGGAVVTIGGTYTALPASFTVELQKLTGEPIQAATAADTASIGSGLFTVNTVTSAPLFALNGTNIKGIVRDNLGNARAVTIAVPVMAAVEPMQLGINENDMGLIDLGPYAVYFDPASYSNTIADLGAKPDPVTGISATENGLGGTVKRGWDGGIGSNSLGLTSYRYGLNPTVTATLVGACTIAFGPGVNITFPGLGNITGWVYNMTTGIASFNITAAGQIAIDTIITVASITALPGGMMKPAFNKTGLSGNIDPAVITNNQALATWNRYLDVALVNVDDISFLHTSLALPVRTPAMRQLGKTRRELWIEHCKLSGSNLWFQHRTLDGDAMIADDIDYVLAQILPSKSINVEFGNERFNAIFTGTHYTKLAGVRAGFAPSALATPGAAVAETVYDAQIPTLLYTGTGPFQTTRAYAAGEKFFANLGFNGIGGWQVWQAIGAQAIGATFTTVSNASFNLIYTNVDTQRAQDRYCSTRVKYIKSVWNTKCDAAGRARPKFVLGAFAAGGFGFVQPQLDWDDGVNTFDIVAPAHYWGGGVGAPDPGAYGVNTIVGWGLAEQEALYTIADQTTAINTVKNSWYAITRSKLIDPAIANMAQYRRDMTAYCIAKGLAPDKLKFGQYEFNWHVVMRGRPDEWPDSAPAYDNAEAYTVGRLVKFGGEIFKNIAASTNVPTSNAANWTRIATAVVAAENRLPLLFTAIMQDPRYGTDYTHYLQQVKKFGGGVCCVYARVGGFNPNGSWGLLRNEGDTGVTNYQYTPVAAFKATL